MKEFVFGPVVFGRQNMKSIISFSKTQERSHTPSKPKIRQLLLLVFLRRGVSHMVRGGFILPPFHTRELVSTLFLCIKFRLFSGHTGTASAYQGDLSSPAYGWSDTEVRIMMFTFESAPNSTRIDCRRRLFECRPTPMRASSAATRRRRPACPKHPRVLAASWTYFPPIERRL